MAKIDIDKLAKMITEDPDIFLENEGEPIEAPETSPAIEQGQDSIISNNNPRAILDELARIKKRLEDVFYEKDRSIVAPKSGGTQDYSSFWFTSKNSKELYKLYIDFDSVASKIVSFVRSRARFLGIDRDRSSSLERDYITNVVTPLQTSTGEKGIRINLVYLERLYENMYSALQQYEESQNRK